MNYYKLNTHFKSLRHDKIAFINELHDVTNISIILSTELFLMIFKDKDVFTFDEVDAIVSQSKFPLVHRVKINNVITMVV